jgi:hypothetical protein
MEEYFLFKLDAEMAEGAIAGFLALSIEAHTARSAAARASLSIQDSFYPSGRYCLHHFERSPSLVADLTKEEDGHVSTRTPSAPPLEIDLGPSAQ